MELKKRFSFKIVFFSLYGLTFLVYLIVGFLPAEAIYAVDAQLKIPAIDLVSDVTNLKLQNNELVAPDSIVGSFSEAENKTLLIGHSTTVFDNLAQLNLNEIIVYKNKLYKVTKKELLEKNKISMRKILKSEMYDTIIIMTCAGELLENLDATHRLIITAIKL